MMMMLMMQTMIHCLIKVAPGSEFELQIEIVMD